MDVGGAGFGFAFIIFAVAPGAPMPGVGPFHNPTFRQWRKARAAFWTFLHFDPPPRPMRCEPRFQGMMVRLASAKDDRAPWEILCPDLGQEFDRGGSII